MHTRILSVKRYPAFKSENDPGPHRLGKIALIKKVQDMREKNSYKRMDKIYYLIPYCYSFFRITRGATFFEVL